jgi:phosphatidylglycerophosphate synthase
LRKKYTLQEIKASLTEETNSFDRKYPWNHYVTRQLSFYMTWLILPLGLNANQITIVSFFIGLASCGFFLTGFLGGIIGAILFNIFFVFDGVDGNIARLTGTTSFYGKYLDGKVGMTMQFFPYLFIGFGLYLYPDEGLNQVLSLFGVQHVFQEAWFIVLGMAPAILVLFNNMLKSQYSMLVIRSGKKSELERGATLNYPASIPHSLKTIYWLYDNIISAQQGIWLPGLILAAITQSLSLFLSFFTAAHFLDILINEIWHKHRIKKLA